jgi:hypothetical protein
LDDETNPKNAVLIRSVTVTCTKGELDIELGGMQTFMLGGILAGHTGTGLPDNDVGNATCTELDSAFATSPAPLYPFNAAYRHGAAVEPLEQLNVAGGEPAGKFPITVVLDVFHSMSITAAVHAASAAL